MTGRRRIEPVVATPVGRPPSLFVQRLKIWLLFAFMLVLGTGAVWWALTDLVDAARELASGAPLLELSSMDVRGLLAGLGVLALVPLCVPIGVPGPPPRRSHRRVPKARFDWPAMLMGTALILILLCLVAPPIVMVAVGEVAVRHGYRLCPDPADEHRPPMRWARTAPSARCPASWREARRMLP